jgi:hypothetical protein
MTGYESKRAAARDKLVDDRRAYYEKFDDLYAVYLNGVYDGKKAPQRPWVGLTDEEIKAFDTWHDNREEEIGWVNPSEIVAYIEARLKEKNT